MSEITHEKLEEMINKDFARPIEGFPYYYITRESKVISTIKHQGIDIKYMTPKIENNGYVRYYLRNRVTKKTSGKLAHRLVAIAFLPNPYKYKEVNHKDENKVNNHIENLEWCTRKYNINYGTGQKRKANKLTNGKQSKRVGQYDMDGNLISVWESAMECGRNGFGQGNVTNCCNGKLNHYKGSKWKYL